MPNVVDVVVAVSSNPLVEKLEMRERKIGEELLVVVYKVARYII